MKIVRRNYCQTVSGNRIQSLMLLLIMALCSPSLLRVPAAYAQGTNATLSGSVTDPSGALISNAHITMLNTATNFTRSVESTGAGVYFVSDLVPGNYTVTASHDGFSKIVQLNVKLTVGQSATLNFSLKVGDQQQTVTVTGTAELINATSAEISSVVDEQAIKQMPLNGRDPSSLVLLAPGVTSILNSTASAFQTTNSFPNETGASANGGQQGSTYYLLDGVPNVDVYLRLALPFPNADATQEFRVITSNFEAQYGFSPGAVVTIQTKSGSNALHGGAFEFIRNNDLNAGNYFSHAVDPLKRNQFGGYLGGPMIKDKLFFFGNYQGTQATTTPSTNASFTPTAAMLRGDFSQVPLKLSAPFNQPGQAYNVIDPVIWSKISSPGAQAFAQNVPRSTNETSGQINFVGAPSKYSYNEGTGRLDYNLSERQQLFFRSYLNFLDQAKVSLNGNILPFAPSETGRIYSELLGHTWSISPKLVNVSKFAWLRNDFLSNGSLADKNGAAVCLSRYINVQDPAGQCNMQGFSITNGFALPQAIPNRVVRTTYQITDSLSYLRGNHSITVGADVARQYSNQTSAFPTNANVTFNGFTTKFGLADFLLGDVSTFSQGNPSNSPVQGWEFAVFGQDIYKITPHLTLTAGLRWEPNTPPVSLLGGAMFIPGQQSTRYPNAPTGLVYSGDRGVNDSLMPTSYRVIEPRIGLAYQPPSLPHTAIRAGFGMFAAPLFTFIYNHVGQVAPFSSRYTINATLANPVSFENPWSSYKPTNFKSPFPPFAQNPHIPASQAVFITPVQVGQVFSPNFRLGVTQSWTASIEQQLTNSLALHLAYVGSQSYHQTMQTDQNPGIFASGSARTTYPNFAAILEYTDQATTSYHSLQIGVDQHLTHNLQFQSNFTYGRTIDIISEEKTLVPSDPFDLNHDRGPSNQNIPLISVTNLVYTSPKLQRLHPVLRTLLGTWGVSGLYTMQSGGPFSVAGGSGNNNSGAFQNGDRANLVPGQSFRVHQGSKQQWLAQYFNTAAFVTNPKGTFGNSGRNILTGPGINTADAGINKSLHFHERYGLELRWEMFNAFNHPSFGLPSAAVGSATNGKIIKIGPVAPRVMQGGLKLSF